MKSVLLLAFLGSVVGLPRIETRDTEGTVVDLGSAGVYQGSVINDGKVKTWRGIPYAAPPVGSLRFRPPQTLQAQNDSVQDFSQDFPDLPTSCVQFGTTSWTKGPNAGPGVEDCLRLWIFTPANSTQKSKLPVHLYYHGGLLLIIFLYCLC